jgi:serine/threonine protein phosphatase PrpC
MANCKPARGAAIRQNTAQAAAILMFHELKDKTMEKLISLFEGMGIHHADEQNIIDFFHALKEEIKSMWDMWDKQHASTTKDVEKSDDASEKDMEQSEDSTEISDEKPQETMSTSENPEKNMDNSENSVEKTEKSAAAIDDQAPSTNNHAPKNDAANEIQKNQIKNLQIRLPNGKVGKDYEYPVDNIAEVSFEHLENIGLHYSPQENKINGKPTAAGDHKITMQIKLKDWTQGKSLMLTINPDPKSLWTNEPTPLDIEYYKKDSDYDFVMGKSMIKEEIPRKDMVAASQRGRSHAIEAKPRDDDFALYFDEQTQWYIMAVADGAGSAKFSREGARIAVNTAVEVCKTQLQPECIGDLLEEQIKLYWNKKNEERRDAYEFLYQVVGGAAHEARKKIAAEAQKMQRQIKEYSTTLLLTICKKFDFGWFVGAWWVGDGGIGIYRKDAGEVKIMGEPDGGEFAGQTRFLTMSEIFKDRARTKFEIVEDFTAIILMTDGVTDPKFETDANLNRIEKWHELWEDLQGNNEDNLAVKFSDDNQQTAEQLLKWLDFWSKGNHDDRTIAILF